MNQLSDEYIMGKVKSGNIDYMTVLFNRYNNQILNYFFRLLNNLEDSQDLTQTVFFRLIKYKTSFNQSQCFKSWIYQISKNVLNNHLQSNMIKSQNVEILNQLPAKELSECRNDEKLYQSINSLSDEYKELIVLSKFQGLKYKEIAEMFSTTEASIKNKVFRALDKLRTIYFETD